jgi:DNA replicative helicase MCM subunit Mcm2 (Cdc46/Mcm family)
VVQQFLKKTENQKRIKEMIGNRQKRLGISIDEVRQFQPDLASFIVRSPIEAIKMFEDLLNLEVQDAQGNAGQ